MMTKLDPYSYKVSLVELYEENGDILSQFVYSRASFTNVTIQDKTTTAEKYSPRNKQKIKRINNYKTQQITGCTII